MLSGKCDLSVRVCADKAARVSHRLNALPVSVFYLACCMQIVEFSARIQSHTTFLVYFFVPQQIKKKFQTCTVFFFTFLYYSNGSLKRKMYLPIVS